MDDIKDIFVTFDDKPTIHPGKTLFTIRKPEDIRTEWLSIKRKISNKK